MDQYNEYLAAHVLNEKEIVTYRTLSRALKVHVNLAKQMLWDFHNRQNTKKPGTVHATYLLSGRRKAKTTTIRKDVQAEDGADTIMDSSPPLPGSSMPHQDESQEAEIPRRSILLVKEEHLEKAKTTFIELRGIHVYSLQSKGLSDFQTLTECTRKIFATLRTEDTLQTGKQYGTIQNKRVKRRSTKTPLPSASIPKTTTSSKSNAGVTTTAKSKEVSTKTESEKPAAGKTENEKPAASKTTSKPATLKREGSSIMASFAKNASKPKTKSAPAATEKESEDTMMANMSDDDPADDAEEVDIDLKAPAGKSKQDREAELKAMMDAEDEEMADNIEPEAEPEPEPEAEEAEAKPESQTENITSEGGRRRGRRKVTKKRTVRDEEGYLVTKEEAVWESFSEDEPAPKKAKTQAPVSTAKKSGKPGQGNIMSFFGKK